MGLNIPLHPTNNHHNTLTLTTNHRTTTMASDNDYGDQFLNDDEEEDIDLINDDDDSTSVTVAVAGTPTVTTTTVTVTPSTIDSRRLFQKLWTDEDEIELLQGYYDHITTRGMMTSSSHHHHHDTTAFYDEIKGKLQLEFNKNQLVEKLRRLKKKYRNVVSKLASGKEYVFKSPHDQAAFDISCKIWNNDDEVQNHNLNGNGNGNGNGNEIGDMEKKRSRKRSRSSGVKIEEGYVQPLQQFGHGLGVGNEGGVSRNVNANVVEETVKSCLLPLFKELVNSSSNGGSRGLGLGGMNLDSFGVGDMSDEKWRKQHILELEVYLKRLELMQDQVKSRLDELKSMGS